MPVLPLRGQALSYQKFLPSIMFDVETVGATKH